MKFVSFILILGAILILGCAGSQPQTANQSNQQNAPTNAQNAPSNASAQNQGAGGVPQPNNASAGGSGTQQTPPSYSGTFGALAQMDIPLVCDVNYAYLGKAVKARLYLDGPAKIRVESPVGVGQCSTTITVIRGTVQDVGCDRKQITPGCDWYRSSYDPGKPGSASAFDFSTLGGSSISCSDWVYDAAKFDSPGTSCQLGG